MKKIWSSAKEVAIKVFKDYKVVNGSGTTYLYDKLNALTINGRLYNNSYWFRNSELLQHFNVVPKKLNIENIRKAEKQRRVQNYKLGQANKTHTSLYCVEKYVDDVLVETYMNTFEAGYELKLTAHTVQKLCRGVIHCADYVLKYGKKVLQPIKFSYPKYDVLPVNKLQRVSRAKRYVKHRTRYTVIQYDSCSNIINTYKNVREASQKLRITEGIVRHICKNTVIKDNLYLKYGEKIRVSL